MTMPGPDRVIRQLRAGAAGNSLVSRFIFRRQQSAGARVTTRLAGRGKNDAPLVDGVLMSISRKTFCSQQRVREKIATTPAVIGGRNYLTSEAFERQLTVFVHVSNMNICHCKLLCMRTFLDAQECRTCNTAFVGPESS